MKPAHRRRQILEAACELFAAQGYHETSVSDIVAAAGIARGTFYLYFDGKRALFDELVDRFIVAIESCVRMVEVAPGAPPPHEQLRGNVSRVLALLVEEREMSLILINHAAGLDRESDEKLRAFHDRVIDSLVRAIETGRRLGMVRTRDPEIAARYILGGVKEVVHFIVVRATDSRDHDRLVEQVLETALAGLGAGPRGDAGGSRSTRHQGDAGGECGNRKRDARDDRPDRGADRDGDTADASEGAGATAS